MTVDLDPKELHELKFMVHQTKLHCIKLRDGFQPDTKSYAEFQARVEFWHNLQTKLHQ